MADLRQDIIDRLLAILGGVLSAPDSIFHNRGVLPPEKRPAIVLLDGDEEVNSAASRSRVIMPPTPVTLTPQVFYLARERPPQNEGIGEELSAVRVSIIRAVCTDDDLVNLVGGPRSSGRIAYKGCATDMKTGSSMRGELQMFFEIVYDLHPASL